MPPGRMAADYRLRGADAVYVVVARRFGTTLITLDVEQRRRIAGLLTSLTPVHDWPERRSG